MAPEPMGAPFVWVDDVLPEPGDVVTATTTAPAPSSAPSTDELEKQITAIKGTPAYRRGDPATLDKILALRRQSLGADNHPVATLDGSEDATPDGDGYTRQDLERAIVSWAPTAQRRYIAATEAMGGNYGDGVRLASLIEAHRGKLSAATEDDDGTLDLDTLWGDQADANIKSVNGLLTGLLKHSQADHDELLPFVQRVPGVAHLLVSVAKRHARK